MIPFRILCVIGVAVVMSVMSAGGQDLDSLAIVEKARTEFKNNYVDQTFEDPYSYELLKIDAIPLTLGEKLEKEIPYLEFSLKSHEDTIRFSKFSEAKNAMNKQAAILDKGEKLKAKDYDKYLEKYSTNLKLHEDAAIIVKSHRDAIAQLKKDIADKNYILATQTSDLNEIVQWRINIDCYGSNSYGRKVLGKYTFKLNTDGSRDGSFWKMN